MTHSLSSTRPRLLITGGSSYLGRHLVALATAGYDVRYTYFSHDPLRLPAGERLDLRQEQATRQLVQAWQPAIIIHTAGSNRSPDMARVILQGTAHLASAAAAVGARLIFLSTDVLFDGRHAPYAESAPPQPIHGYGRAKAAAEKQVAACANHVIVRSSLIYGLEEMDHGTAWLVAALQAGQPVTLFTDQIRQPVWVITLCRALLELASLPYTGILHVAGRQAMSRAEFGPAMLDWWGVRERRSLRFGPGDGARWPSDCRLVLDRAQEMLATPLWGVDEVLKRHEQTDPGR